MPIEQRITVTETLSVTIGGQTITGDPEPVGEILIATRKSDGEKYARLQFDGSSYVWTGDVADVDENTSADVTTETRWGAE